jgi:hypothetical protein
MLFLLSVQELRQAAALHDIAAAGDAYAALVSTCVHCHTYIRDARRASLATVRPVR